MELEGWLKELPCFSLEEFQHDWKCEYLAIWAQLKHDWFLPILCRKLQWKVSPSQLSTSIPQDEVEHGNGGQSKYKCLRPFRHRSPEWRGRERERERERVGNTEPRRSQWGRGKLDLLWNHQQYTFFLYMKTAFPKRTNSSSINIDLDPNLVGKYCPNSFSPQL